MLIKNTLIICEGGGVKLLPCLFCSSLILSFIPDCFHERSPQETTRAAISGARAAGCVDYHDIFLLLNKYHILLFSWYLVERECVLSRR